MAFPIMELDYPNVKRTLRPPIPPSYHLGLIPAGHALRRMKHYKNPEGKAVALASFSEWSHKSTFLEGKCYLDQLGTTAISTAFFLEVLPPHASTWERQTYTEVGDYPYLDSPRDILIESVNLDELTNDATLGQAQSTARVIPGTEPAWQRTDITTDLHELAKLVEEADEAETAEEKPDYISTCQQRFTHKQLITLASALYRTPYTLRRYTKRGDWNSVISVCYLEPTALPPIGKRFALEAQSHDNPTPWYRPPCTFLTASTSYSFADLALHQAMITLWNAAHTPTKRLPKLLQKGIVSTG